MRARGAGAGVSAAARVFLLAAVASSGAARFADPPPLVLDRTVDLPDVAGRVDHLWVGRRVVVAELGNGSVEVYDPASGTRLSRMSDLMSPQGVCDLPDFGRIAVATGGDGRLTWYDGRTYVRMGDVTLGEDADNVRFDARRGRLWVGYGSDGWAGLAELDCATGRLIGEIHLPAHPESFQLESAGTRIFVNVPREDRVMVADRATMKTVGGWTQRESGIYAMALDEVRGRVLVASRNPARLIVLGMDDGSRIATVPCPGDCDDIWWDGVRDRAYLSCGAGALCVVGLSGHADYRIMGRIRTPSGARTSVFDSESDRLWLAVPRRGSRPASLRVFRIP